MALNANRLKGTLKQAYIDMDAANVNLSREDALDLACEKLAAAIVAEIKNLQIVYTGGLTAGVETVIGVINHNVT